MSKQPYQMTKDEFDKTFPFFSALSARDKWRCYRINNKVNYIETGEFISFKEFEEFAVLFRWDTAEMYMLRENDHAYFIQVALHWQDEIPCDVLAEYPELVEEYIEKQVKQKREQQKRLERRKKEKDKKVYESLVDKEERAFWSNF